jgi:hypothetical protein
MVRARPCKLAPGAGPQTLTGYSGIVLAVDELLEEIQLRDINTFGQRTATPDFVSILDGADKVEEARRQACGEEPFKGKVTPSYTFWETFYKWRADMMPPRRRGVSSPDLAPTAAAGGK